MTATHLPRASPLSEGVDPAGIASFLDAAGTEGVELHSVMVVRGGAVVAEGYWHPYAARFPHMQHSAAKSWTATAIGLLWGDGSLALDAKVIGFFPDDLPDTVSAHLAAMTVEDLLTMRTGHRTGISGGEWRGSRESWVRAFLREPIPDCPGEAFIYSSGSTYMLSAIATKVSGRTAQDIMQERVFAPLGMSDIQWDLSPEGFSTGGNGVSCLTEDSAKLGLLYLAEGVWDGQQILPAAWVREASRPHVADAWLGALDGRRYGARDLGAPVPKNHGYGYQWWMTAQGGYRASGMFGQQSIVLPRHDAVIAITAGVSRGNTKLVELIWRHLVPALGAASIDPAAEHALTERLAALALPRLEGSAHAPTAARVSGRVFQTAPNEDGVTSVALRFEADACVFTLTDHRGTHHVRAGLGTLIEGDTSMTGNRLHHEYQPDLMRVVAEGSWRDPSVFVMTWRFVETAFSDTVTCRFHGDRIEVDRRVNTNAAATERPTLHGTSR